MSNYVEVYKIPKFIIRDNNNNKIDEFNLSLTDENGMVLSIEPNRIIHVFQSGRIFRKVNGNRFHWTLSYQSYSDLNTSKGIEKILNYEKDGKRIFVVPISTYLQKQYEVFVSSESIDLGIIYDGNGNPVVNKLMVVTFTTIQLHSRINFINPDEVQYSGYYYDYQF